MRKNVQKFKVQETGKYQKAVARSILKLVLYRKFQLQICKLVPNLAVYQFSDSKIKYNLNYKQKILILGAGFLGQTLSRILKIIAKNFQIDILDRNEFKLNLKYIKISFYTTIFFSYL